jgi:hypothetical protein
LPDFRTGVAQRQARVANDDSSITRIRLTRSQRRHFRTLSFVSGVAAGSKFSDESGVPPEIGAGETPQPWVS